MCKYVVCVFTHSLISIFLFLRSESWRITQSTCRLQRQDSVSYLHHLKYFTSTLQFISFHKNMTLTLAAALWRWQLSAVTYSDSPQVSPHVEKCLQETKREMSSERQSVSARRPEQCGIMSDKLQEVTLLPVPSLSLWLIHAHTHTPPLLPFSNVTFIVVITLTPPPPTR